MGEPDTVLFLREGNVAIISLNRPDRLNAVGGDMLERLMERGREAAEDPSVAAVVFTGEGRAFCAGADLQAPAARGGAPATPMRERFPIRPDTGWPASWFGLSIPKPVVAAINGAAVGWGAEMLATCDMRVAGESGRMGWVFARRGLVTDMAVGPTLLPRIVGIPQAARLLYSGEVVDAREALRIGLVDEVVPDAELRERAVALAHRLGGGAPNSIAVHKRQIYGTLRRDPHEIYLENLDEFARTMASEDFKEGVRSFLEKREPAWTGR